jgi:hypothetical protein
MTFKEFLQNEQGTQGEGPTASGQRGSSLMSPSTYQAPKLNTGQPQSKKAKGGSFGGGNDSLPKAPGGPLGSGGIGQLAPAPKPGLFGAQKYEPMKPSPFSSTGKYSPPQNLDWPKKASK